MGNNGIIKRDGDTDRGAVFGNHRKFMVFHRVGKDGGVGLKFSYPYSLYTHSFILTFDSILA